MPVDAASLAVLRILFGLVMFVAMVRFLALGRVQTLYLDPEFHFPWFSWIRPWADFWMHVHVVLLALCALGVAVGFCYRWSAALFCIGFTWLELIDRSTYLNHYYLVSLLSGLLVFLPAQRQWSMDARRNRPGVASTVPAWTVWLLRFQLGVVYVFSGLAKLNADWLFAAQPLRMWLMARSDLPVVGPWLAEPWVAYAAGWFGAAFDLTIPFLLMASRTRAVAYATLVVFHVMTAVLFPIGMFPWIMIAATLIFFPPDWPRPWAVSLPQRHRDHRDKTSELSAMPSGAGVAQVSQPATAGSSYGPPIWKSATQQVWKPALQRLRFRRLVPLWLGAYCAIQVLVPLRSWLYPQQGAWGGRGFNFSWRVMLVDKTGYAEFFAVDPVAKRRERIALARYLTPRQQTMMAQDPHLIRAFAQYLGREYLAGGAGREIHVDAFATLNGRPGQRLVRGDINLSGPVPADWIVPLRERNDRRAERLEPGGDDSIWTEPKPPMNADERRYTLVRNGMSRSEGSAICVYLRPSAVTTAWPSQMVE